jgi:hypothetical protein
MLRESEPRRRVAMAAAAIILLLVTASCRSQSSAGAAGTESPRPGQEMEHAPDHGGGMM